METLGFSKTKFAYYFLATLGLHLVSYTGLGIPLSVLFLCVGVLLLFVSVEYGISFFLFSILVFDDINKYDPATLAINNIFTVEFFGQSISMLWSIMIFLVTVSLLVYRKQASWRVAPLVLVLLLFFVLGSIRFYQVMNPMFASDIAFVINLLLGYVVGMRLMTSEIKIRYYFAMIVCVFISKYIIMTSHGIFASVTGVFYYLAGESASNFVILPLAVVLLLLFNKRIEINRSEKAFVLVSLIFITCYLFIAISRERILFVVLLLLAYSIVYKRTKVLLYLGAFFIVAVFLIAELNQNMYRYVTWKLTTFLPTSGGVANPSPTVRYLEFKNIWQEQLSDPYKLFIGTGWGGYFTADNFAFSSEILGTKSYPEEWIERDSFFKPHGTYLYVFLKYGLLGTILFYGTIFLYSLRNIFDKAIYSYSPTDKDKWGLRYIQIALALTLPIVSLVIFTSKLQILFGFFLAMMFYARAEIRKG